MAESNTDEESLTTWSIQKHSYQGMLSNKSAVQGVYTTNSKSTGKLQMNKCGLGYDETDMDHDTKDEKRSRKLGRLLARGQNMSSVITKAEEANTTSSSLLAGGKGSRTIERHGSGMKSSQGKLRPGEPMSLSHLRKLQQEDPENIILDLISNNSGFDVLLHVNALNCVTTETILSTVGKALSAKHMPESISCLLRILQDSCFVVQHVAKYLAKQSIDPSITKVDVLNLIAIIMKMLQHLPSSSVNTTTLILTQLHTVVQEVKTDDDCIVSKKLDELTRLHKNVIQQVRSGALKKNLEKETEDSLKPPDDFRSINIIPTTRDLFSEEEPFLRKNKVIGQYDSVDQYLDIHFRLLREDFVAPLRDGINQYIKMKKEGFQGNHSLTDIRVYTGVRIEFPQFTRRGTVYAVRFDTSMLQNIRWETSKRFKYGSLVCMSADNFKTLVFGTVEERNASDLREGKVFIAFEQGSLGHIHNLALQYDMVESASYFEAYRHNLEALQTLNDLPFKKYLLQCESVVDAPQYLRNAHVEYDFSCLIVGDKNMQGKLTRVLDTEKWPSAKHFGMDVSQYRALQTALTKEFAIIQGPPGTGKTFLGLKIMQTLLQNKSHWNKPQKAPILVVCYTNHALDQFLEGILLLTGLPPEELIRLGGQSSSDVLKRCNIRHRCSKKDHSTNQQHLLAEMEKVKSHVVQQIGVVLSMQHAVLHEEFVKAVMLPHHFNSLMEQKTSSQSIMVRWLVQDPIFNDVPKRADKHQVNKSTIDEQNIDMEESAHLDTENESLGEAYRMYEAMQMRHPATVARISSRDSQNVDSEGFTKSKSKRQKKTRHKLLHFQLIENKYDIMSIEEENDSKNLWQLGPNDRWRLYRSWLSRLCAESMMRIQMDGQKYNRLACQLKELDEISEYEVVVGATIIGMTTTGAAKYRGILQRVKPKIVIVEEAAEVLESHIVTTLTESSQHLILIGDHQQLRPNPAVYRLAKKYNLDISLFERMVNNNTHCDKLSIQHRMRPQIVELIVPSVYKDLHNHETVFGYEDVKGIMGNLYFIEHSNNESNVEDLKSRSNQHEAEFVVALARYLIQQGYNSSRITILTTYTGQMFLIRRLLSAEKKPHDTPVRVTPVDNFQGEENDIILLSLVRSNQEGKVGFLKIENRICVALSRAKIALYVIGNMSLLQESSTLWQDIGRVLEQKGTLVDALPLACQNHPQAITKAKYAIDFENAPDGGCMAKCEFRLDCGHSCNLRCHPFDPQHKNYNCQKPCTKILCEFSHICPKLCHEECSPCLVLVEKEIPKCHHMQYVPCSKEADNFRCKEKCLKMLQCGHTCSELCGDIDCTIKCNVVVHERLWPCGHKLSTPCFQTPDTFPCNSPAEKILKCGHTKTTICSSIVDDLRCFEYVDQKCERDHVRRVKCYFAGEAKCYETMVKICPRQHTYQIMCCNFDSDSCPNECLTDLPCGHVCQGKCGECLTSGKHSQCRMQCSMILVCGHQCSGYCGGPCPPCDKRCGTYCNHTSCRHICGLKDCWRCKKPCAWKCRHKSCERLCWQPCIRQPCDKPCKMTLECGHRCVGLCGEVCPLCPVCQSDVFKGSSQYLNTPLKATSRFVMVEPCLHVVEVTYMDDFMLRGTANEESKPLQAPRCPVCSSRIFRCNRYSRIIKQFTLDLDTLKMKLRKLSDDSSPWENLPRPLATFLEEEFCSKNVEELSDDVYNAGSIVRLFASTASCNKTLRAKLDSKYQVANTTEPVDLTQIQKEMESALDEGDYKSLRGVLPRLMLTYMMCHVRVMLTFMKNIFLSGILKRIEAELHVLSVSEQPNAVLYRMYCSKNAEIKGRFYLRNRNFVECFLKDVADCFAQKETGLQKTWWICQQGHVFGKKKEGSPAACPECYRPVDETPARRTWLQDLADCRRLDSILADEIELLSDSD